MSETKDIAILRELARRVAELAAKPVQDERRDLWRRHNSLQPTRALVYVNGVPWGEIPEVRDLLQCEDRFYWEHERQLRLLIYQDYLGDDCIIEPWINIRAAVITPPEGLWGVPTGRIPSPLKGGAWKFDPAIKELDDIKKLVKPHHQIDEEATARDVSRLQDAVGDIVEVNVDRGPAWFFFDGDISTHLAYMRGLEQVMWDMVDNPEWLHGLLAFMRDGILAAQDEAEAAGDWNLAKQGNQAMRYSLELPDPKPNGEPVTRDKVWTFCSAQEFTLISPQMHDEFMLQYQIPIIEKFGLSAYGCCEDLTEKIDMLRKVRNLRRIAVTPVANVRRCAEQIGRDYVFSWRPNPTDMVCCGFDPDHIRKVIKTGLDDAKGCHVDIILKDLQTVENQPERLRECVRIIREVCDQ